MICAVIDTNVIVSALICAGESSPPARIVQAVFGGKVVPAVCDEILTEYLEVLSRPKFGFDTATVSTFVDGLSKLAVRSQVRKSGILLSDTDDVIFYDTALANNAVLITGNTRHFPDTPSVMTPAQFVKMFL